MKSKLKPCPFCGAKGKDISLKCKSYHGGALEVDGAKFWFVECLPCDARSGDFFDGDAPMHGYKNGKEMAISFWNRRNEMKTVHTVIEHLDLNFKFESLISSIRKKYPDSKWKYNKSKNWYENNNGWIIKWISNGENTYHQLYLYKPNEGGIPAFL